MFNLTSNLKSMMWSNIKMKSLQYFVTHWNWIHQGSVSAKSLSFNFSNPKRSTSLICVKISCRLFICRHLLPGWCSFVTVGVTYWGSTFKEVICVRGFWTNRLFSDNFEDTFYGLTFANGWFGRIHEGSSLSELLICWYNFWSVDLAFDMFRPGNNSTPTGHLIR